MHLTDEEMKKFAAYCRQCAEDSKAIIEQANKLDMMEPMLKMLKLEKVAYEIVANKLDNTETTTIG